MAQAKQTFLEGASTRVDDIACRCAGLDIQVAEPETKAPGNEEIARMNSWKHHFWKASRTLALSSQSLEEPLRMRVTFGVLALHATREMEAATPWPPLQRRRVMLSFAALSDAPSRSRAQRLLGDVEHGSQSLLSELSGLVDCIAALPERPKQVIWHHSRRAAERSLAYCMRIRPDGRVMMKSAEELADFCLARTGITAEMVTDLIIDHDERLSSAADELRAYAAPSGQVVGLVNYLDGQAEPYACPARLANVGERQRVIALSRARMGYAERYVEALRTAGAQRGVVAFAALPIAWAKIRLDRLQCCEGGCVDQPSRPPLHFDHSALGIV